MDGFEAVVGELRANRIEGEIWVDGSFLTQKIDPEDVDILFRTSGDFVNRVTTTQEQLIGWFLQDDDVKDTYKCDTYLLIDYPDGHPEQAHSEWMRAYWVKQYGFSRGEDFKGIAVVAL